MTKKIYNETLEERRKRLACRARIWRSKNEERVRLYRRTVVKAKRAAVRAGRSACDYLEFLEYVPKPVTLPRLQWLERTTASRCVNYV